MELATELAVAAELDKNALIEREADQVERLLHRGPERIRHFRTESKAPRER